MIIGFIHLNLTSLIGILIILKIFCESIGRVSHFKFISKWTLIRQLIFIRNTFIGGFIIRIKCITLSLIVFIFFCRDYTIATIDFINKTINNLIDCIRRILCFICLIYLINFIDYFATISIAIESISDILIFNEEQRNEILPDVLKFRNKDNGIRIYINGCMWVCFISSKEFAVELNQHRKPDIQLNTFLMDGWDVSITTTENSS